MGIFGGNKSEESNAVPEKGLLKTDPSGHDLPKKTQQLKAEILPTIDKMTLALMKSDEQKQLATSLIIMQQNEIIIKYLNDISKKLDNLK